MSDPKRISRLLLKVDRLWRAHPDWSLGQLIYAVTTHENPSDIGGIADDTMEWLLDAALSTPKRPARHTS